MLSLVMASVMMACGSKGSSEAQVEEVSVDTTEVEAVEVDSTAVEISSEVEEVSAEEAPVVE